MPTEEYFLIEEKFIYDSNYVIGMAYFLIQDFEGFKSRLSVNQTDGNLDIGYGFVWEWHGEQIQKMFGPMELGSTMTVEQANDYLYILTIQNYNYLNKKMKTNGNLQMSAGEQIACISLIHNVGVGSFGKNTVCHFRSKDKRLIGDSFINTRPYITTREGTVVVDGLKKRRKLEKQIFDASDDNLDSLVRQLIIANRPKGRK